MNDINAHAVRQNGAYDVVCGRYRVRRFYPPLATIRGGVLFYTASRCYGSVCGSVGPGDSENEACDPVPLYRNSAAGEIACCAYCRFSCFYMFLDTIFTITIFSIFTMPFLLKWITNHSLIEYTRTCSRMNCFTQRQPARPTSCPSCYSDDAFSQAYIALLNYTLSIICESFKTLTAITC